MNRRDALLTTGSMVLSASIGAIACGAPAVAQNNAMPSPPPPPPPPAGHHHGNPELHAAASACLDKGGACLAHCIALLSSGDTTMAGCSKTVHDMHAMMVGLAAVSASGSAHLPEVAKVAMVFCDECERECRKHAEMHVVCKECADACARTKAACAAVVG